MGNQALDGIAIISMAGRFPGAGSIGQFWANLRAGVESISFFSPEELRAAGVDAAAFEQPNYVPARGVIEGADLFDAAFFGYNPREAESIDPQQRLFLESCWQALEKAGYPPRGKPMPVGVFAGVTQSTYVYDVDPSLPPQELVRELQVRIGNEKDNLATRVSYKLNLRGPGISVQTSCSTSLVAVALGCQSLTNYECDMVLAGGVSITVPQKSGHVFQEGSILSPDGHCRAFDAEAQGTVGGDGVGVVLLKRLDEAVADGDRIHAVIKGWALNNDGSAKVGYTAPGVEGQAEVISMAQAVAGIEADSVSYVEAHGTGTALGDPIEVAALAKAFAGAAQRTQFCAIGSVKTNVGHLDAAAGVTGLIKTALVVENAEIPPTLHFKAPNPRIDFEHSPFYVARELQPWPSQALPRRAGVSSFGIGGTNAHLVLEQAPLVEPSTPAAGEQLFVISARTEAALDQATRDLGAHLRAHPELDLADVAFTLQRGRAEFAHRRALVAGDLATAAEVLEAVDARRLLAGRADDAEPDVVFMFPGGGAQYPGMTRGLYGREPVFRKHVDQCAELLLPLLGRDVRPLLYPENGQPLEEVGEPAVALPLLFLTAYSLAQLWMHWGVRPAAMIGHSLGEYVAACLANVLSLPDAMRVVAARGRLMQQMDLGMMLSVPLAEAELAALLSGDLSIAAVNGPESCVASGPTESVERLEKVLADRGVETARLHFSHAAHSEMMAPMLPEFRRVLEGVRLQAPAMPFISNVSGTWITPEQATSVDYWVSHVRHTVRFSDGLSQLLRTPNRILLEVGPGQTLSRLAMQHPDRQDSQVALSSVRHPRDTQSDWAFSLAALGQVWLRGVRVDWTGLHGDARRRRVELPTYPFERQRYWTRAVRRGGLSNRKKADIASWFYVPAWTRVPLPAVAARPAEPATWLLFMDGRGVGEALAALLAKRGQHVVPVEPGAAFERLASGGFTLRPGEREDYMRLAGEVGPPVSRVAYLWGAPEHGFYSLLWLTQALQDVRVRVDVITDGVFAVTGGEELTPDKATLLGPVMVMPQEHANISSSFIDLSATEGAETVAPLLLDELLHDACPEPVAYRRGFRWVLRHEPVRIDAPAEAPFRDGAVYLITGGLGGIGLALAKHIAGKARARLVLVSRTAAERAVPEEVAELERRGVEVMIASADVADGAQVASLIVSVQARFGRLDGIIHAAGVPGGGVMQLKTRAQAADVLRPKVEGTLALAQAVRDLDLDFFVLCSSLSSLFGGPGRVDYAAANAFLDAFAEAAPQRSRGPVRAIDWDTWRLGMASNLAVPAEFDAWRADALEAAISPEEGGEVLERAIASRFPRLIVSTRDLEMRRLADSQVHQEQLLRTEDQRQAASGHRRPVLSSTYVAPNTPAEHKIVQLWQEMLGIDEVGVNDNFFELGGHSLLAIRLVSALKSIFETPLPIQAVFDHPTPAELAAQVDAGISQGSEADELRRLLEEVEGLSEEDVATLNTGGWDPS